MNSALATVLNKVLGDFVEGFNGDQLNVSLFSGKLVLEKMHIRPEAIDQLGLPVVLRYGVINSIQATIPWTSLGSSPLKVEVKGVYMLFRPRTPDMWSNAQVLDAIEAGKQARLDRFEFMNSDQLAAAQAPGFVEKLVSKIVDNLQISLSNVYIRYEDFQSSSEPFAAGLIVKQAEVATCNAAWEPEFVVDSPITYKSAEIVGLALYVDYGEGCEVDSAKIPGKSPEKSFENLSRKESDLNFLIKHRFILSACGCIWHLTLSKSTTDFSVPRVAVNMQLGGETGVIAGLELKQVTHCVKLMEFFGKFGTFQAGVQATVSYRELADSEGEEYRGIYIDWKLKPEAERKEALNRLKSLEKSYDFDSIAKQRRAAREEIQLFEREEEAKKALSSAAQTTSGGFKAFFGFGKSKETQEQEEAARREKLEAAERELQRIKEAREHFRQELATFLESAPVFIDLPQTYERFTVKLELGSVHWTLRSDSMELLSTQLGASSIEAFIRVLGTKVVVRAGPFSLKDHIEPSDLYPQMLEIDCWALEYTDYPTDDIKKLELNTGESFCTVNFSSIFTLIQEVKATILAELDVDRYRETLQTTVMDLVQRGKDYMQELASKGMAPQSLQISLHCKAPCLLIPLDLKGRQALVADFGLLTLQTSPATRDWNGVEETRSDQAVYDKYQFTASDFILATLWDFQEARKWRSGEVETILAPSPFALCVSSSVFPEIDPVLDIIGTIESLQARLSDIQMKFILQLQSSIIVTKARILPSEDVLVPEDNIEHTEMLKDTMKRTGKLISQRVVLEVGSAAGDLYRGKECLAHCELTALRGELRLHEDSRLAAAVSMREIKLMDARPNQGFPAVVSMLAGSIIPAIDLKCVLSPTEDKIELQAAMSHLNILFNPEFISAVLAFFTASSQLQLAHSQSLTSAVKCKQEVASKSERRLKQQEIAIRCTAFSVLVLESHASQTLLRLRFDTAAEYKGRMEYVDLRNNKEEVFSREILSSEDSGNVQVSELEVSAGALQQVQNLQSYKAVKAGLFSARSVEVRVSSMLRDGVTEVVLTVDIRQVGLIIGFADIRVMLAAKDLCMTLGDLGGSQSPVQATSAVVKEDSTSYSLSMYSDEISVCLVDDTEQRFLPLLRLRLPACSLSFKYSALKLQAALALALAVDYRNGSAAAYEPLLEPWTVEISADQQVGAQDNLLAVTAISRSPLNVNLSSAAGKVLAKILQKWQDGVQSWHYGEGVTSVSVQNTLQYKVKNRLGRSATIWLDGFSAPIDILDGKNQILSEEQWKLEGDIIGYGPIHAISVQVEPLGLASCVLLDQVGQNGYQLQGSSYWLVCRVSFESYYRVITLSSDIQFCNNTEIPVSLRWASGEAVVQPNKTVNAPIGSQLSELILLTPAGNTNLRLLSQMKINGNSFAMLDQLQTKCGAGIHTAYFLNPPITIQNLLPGAVRVAFSADPQLIYTVPAGGEKRIYTQSVTGRVECSWEVYLGGGVDLCCRLQPLKGERNLVALSGQAEEHAIVVDRIPNELLSCGKIDFSLEKIKNKVFAGLLLQPHCPLWIVNHTAYVLDCTSPDEARFVLPASTFLMANSIAPSLRVRVNESCFGKASSWSKAFSIETAGLSGALTLDTSSKAVPSVSLGIRVEQATWPLLKTRTLHIYPRFVVKNQLQSAIYLKQRTQKHTAVMLQPGQHCDYQLAIPSAGSCLQVSADEQHWSCPFSIEDVGDFQIRFMASGLHQESHWWTQNTTLGLMQCAQVSVTSENQAVIVTQLAVPETPDFLVLNETQEQVAVCQSGCKDRTLVMPGASVPFVFDDQFSGSRKVKAVLGRSEQLYNIEKVGKSHKKLGTYHVETCVQAGSRVLRIYTDSDRSSRLMQAPARFSNWKAALHLDCLNLALLDEEPKEQFLLSLSLLQASMTSLDCEYQDLYRTEQYVNILLGSVQIDNMSGKPAEFEVILSQVQRKDEEATPVLQLEIKRNIESRNGSAEVFQCFEYIRVSLQELRLDLHQASVTRLARVIQRALSPFESQLEQSPFAETAVFTDISPGLAPDSSEHMPLSRARSKSYFQLIVLYAAVINLSIKTSPHKVSVMMEEAHSIAPIRSLHRLGAALINISNSKLKFSTVMLKDSFSSLQDIQSQITQNYLRQGYWQVYRLIGSSDMLGNPIGLINKLGSGVFELFNEPRKGLLQGPTEFAQGVRRGVKSFVSNVISGGMGSVSKITGSFYGLLRVAQGDEEGYERINRPDSAAAGVLEGLKGGLTDLAEGVSGIFTKPVEGIKKGGFGGFLRGVKSGLVGAVTAPVSAVLRTGTTITSGISNSASSLSNTLPPARSRLPRQTTARKVVEPYNEGQAQVQAAFRNLKRFRGDKPLFSTICREGVVILTVHHIVRISDSSDYQFLTLMEISGIQLRQGPISILTLTNQQGNRLEVSGKPEVVAQVEAAVRSLAIIAKS